MPNVNFVQGELQGSRRTGQNVRADGRREDVLRSEMRVAPFVHQG